jgi:hypothetical protein
MASSLRIRGRLPFRSSRSRISYQKAVMQKSLTGHDNTSRRIAFLRLYKKTDRSWEVYLNTHNSAISISITNTMQMFEENTVNFKFMATRSRTVERTCTHLTTVYRRTGSYRKSMLRASSAKQGHSKKCIQFQFVNMYIQIFKYIQFFQNIYLQMESEFCDFLHCVKLADITQTGQLNILINPLILRDWRQKNKKLGVQRQTVVIT